MSFDKLLYIMAITFNAVATAVMFCIVIPAMDRNHQDDMEQSKQIEANHQLLLENTRILEENQQIHKENNRLVVEMKAKLQSLNRVLPDK